MKSLIESLEAAVQAQPDAPLYAFLDGTGAIVDSYTYRGLHERSNYVAERLRRAARGLEGRPVLLAYPPGLEFIVAFFACVKIGALPVPVPLPERAGPGGGLDRLRGVAEDSGARLGLTTADAATLLRSGEGVTEWVATDGWRGARRELDARPGPVLFLQYTSGSTQTPRGVVVSHANVLHNGFATLDHAPVAVSWLPHYHDMGLIGYYLYPMLRRGRLLAFSGSMFLKRPGLWLETISRHRATITSAPNFAFEYCLREDKLPSHLLEGLDLSSLRCLMNASEPVRASTCDRFLARFERCGLAREALVVFYGLAENTLSVSGDGRVRLTVNAHRLEEGELRIETPRADARDQRRIMSCGSPRPGIDVKIVDPDARVALGPDQLGEVWVAGESKADGYWNKPALSLEVLGATLRGGTTRHLRTGDLGFMHDGEVFLCGRSKDLIIVGGRNYHPNDIEAVVEHTSDLVRPGYVAAFAVDGVDGETIAIVLEARRADRLPDLEALHRAVRRACQVEPSVIAVVPHGAIAKTSSGKTARQECRRRWGAGEMAAVARLDRVPRPMSVDPVSALLRRVGADDSDGTTLADIGVDSLTLVELSAYLEDAARARGGFDGDLFDLRILQAVTLGELRAFLEFADTGGPVPELVPHTYRQKLRAIESEEAGLMREHMRLPDDVEPHVFAPPGGKVLVTGATGFLGSFLVEALLRTTDRDIVAVVRAENVHHAKSRVVAALQRTGVWSDALRQACDRRVVALPGDIAEPRFGLGVLPWEALSRELSAIYHCGAEVDYVKPYRTLWGPNVSSTLEVLRLAGRGARKTVHYVSTTFIFGFTARDVCHESDRNEEMAGLNFGYTQSKWVAEQLVYEAVRRGLSARIYRPAFVTASRHARYVRRDLLARILAYMIRHRVSTDVENQLSCLPVDVCANNIVALSLLDEPSGRCYHLTADSYYSLRTLCSTISRRYGYAFEYLSLERLIEHLNRHGTRADPIFPLRAFFNHNFRRIEAMREKRYDSAGYRRARARSRLTMPEPDLADTAEALVSYLCAEHLVPAPPFDEAAVVSLGG